METRGPLGRQEEVITKSVGKSWIILSMHPSLLLDTVPGQITETTNDYSKTRGWDCIAHFF